MLANAKQFSSCIRRPLVQSRHVHKLPATSLSTLAKWVNTTPKLYRLRGEQAQLSYGTLSRPRAKEWTPQKLVSEIKHIFEEVHVTLKSATGLAFIRKARPGHAVKVSHVSEGSEARESGKIHVGDAVSKVSAVIEQDGEYKHVVINCLLTDSAA